MANQEEENLKDIKGQVILHREGTRTWLAKAVVFIFVAVLVGAFLVSIFTNVEFNTFSIIISTFSGLLGVVLGFYFGKQND